MLSALRHLQYLHRHLDPPSNSAATARRSIGTTKVYQAALRVEAQAHLPDVDAIRLSRLKKSTLFEMPPSPEVEHVQNEYMRLAAQLWAGEEPCDARSMKDRDIFDFLGFD